MEMVFAVIFEFRTLLKVASILGGLVSEPMEDASTSTRSSSSWVFATLFLATTSFKYVSENRRSR